MDGTRTFSPEHVAQKMRPHSLQWCRRLKKENSTLHWLHRRTAESGIHMEADDIFPFLFCSRKKTSQ